MQTDLITKVYFNEHLTHSCVGMPQGLQALLSSLIRIELILSSLQLFFGFSDFIISKISLESVGLKKSVLLFCFLFNFI